VPVVRACERGEENVAAWPHVADRRVGPQRQGAVALDDEVRVRRCDVHASGLEQVAVSSLLHTEMRLPAENCGEVASVFRKQMEHDDQGCVEILRKSGEHLAERKNATGGSDESDGVPRGSVRRPHSGLRVQPG
jgi:hypothetical protein